MTDWTKYQMSLDSEAQQMSRQTGLRREACKLWMQNAGLTCAAQLMTRYPGKNHRECYAQAANEIENLILSMD